MPGQPNRCTTLKAGGATSLVTRRQKERTTTMKTTPTALSRHGDRGGGRDEVGGTKVEKTTAGKPREQLKSNLRLKNKGDQEIERFNKKKKKKQHS